MTNPSRASGRSSALKRYGPLAAIAVVLVALGSVVVLSGGNGETAKDTSGPGAVTTDGVATPIIYEDAVAAGTADDVTWVDNCDTATGRIMMPSAYAAPCVPKFEGDNGGSTSPGVSADTITVVVYTARPNADVLAALQGADDPELVVETRRDYTTMLQDLTETYGRTVEVVEFTGSGAADDATAALADAVDIAESYEPFAVLGGPALTPVFAEEIARREIFCLGCALGLADEFAQQHAPYIWGTQPSPEQFLVNLSDYILDSLVGRKAEFAGDPALREKERVFGVAHFEQDPPVFTALTERIEECGSEAGYESAVTETYAFDIGKLPERATTIVAKMKAEGVTTVIFMGDPIMPTYLTQQATQQDYYPEWIIAGTVLTDTTRMARGYDQAQWKSAFGLSNLSARTPRELSGAYALHEWYFGRPPAAPRTTALSFAPLSQLFLGIHMAGPELTPETYTAGLFNYPASGGGPTTPAVSYGPDSGFNVLGEDCEFDTPLTDYNGIDDTVEIWWDAEAVGPDEQGKEGTGMWAYANGGRRYGPGEMPGGPSNAFVREDSVTGFDALPAEDLAPDYPSPYVSP